jgi:hypothetical protein
LQDGTLYQGKPIFSGSQMTSLLQKVVAPQIPKGAEITSLVYKGSSPVYENALSPDPTFKSCDFNVLFLHWISRASGSITPAALLSVSSSPDSSLACQKSGLVAENGRMSLNGAPFALHGVQIVGLPKLTLHQNRARAVE